MADLKGQLKSGLGDAARAVSVDVVKGVAGVTKEVASKMVGVGEKMESVSSGGPAQDVQQQKKQQADRRRLTELRGELKRVVDAKKQEKEQLIQAEDQQKEQGIKQEKLGKRQRIKQFIEDANRRGGGTGEVVRKKN